MKSPHETLASNFNMICNKTWNVISSSYTIRYCSEIDFFDMKSQYNYNVEIICSDIPNFGYGIVSINKMCNRDNTELYLSYDVQVETDKHTSHDMRIAHLGDEAFVKKYCERFPTTHANADIGILDANHWYLLKKNEIEFEKDNCVMLTIIIFSSFNNEIERKLLEIRDQVMEKVQTRYATPLNLTLCDGHINLNLRYSMKMCYIEFFCDKTNFDCKTKEKIFQEDFHEDLFYKFCAIVSIVVIAIVLALLAYVIY